MQSTILGKCLKSMLQKPILCVIIEKNERFTPLDIARAALESGVSMVQLRMKNAPAKDVYELALAIKALTKGKALLIVNDRLDIALAAEADGVHLGKEDLPLDAARKMAPPGFLVGASASSLEEANKAQSLGADYLGVGPVFATKNKPTKPPIGLEGLNRVCRSVSIPVLAIGGITPSNAQEALQAQASGVAVISAVYEALEPFKAVQDLLAALKGA